MMDNKHGVQNAKVCKKKKKLYFPISSNKEFPKIFINKSEAEAEKQSHDMHRFTFDLC